MRSVSPKFHASFICIFSAGFLFMKCTHPPPVLQKCPEPFWKEYSSLQFHQVKEAAARLDALLAKGDTISSDSSDRVDSTDTTAAERLSGLEIRCRLFELSIHHANPDYDLDKISEYASFLLRNGGPDSIRYLNWGRAAQEQKALVLKRDSLAAAVVEGGKKESRSAEKLKKEIKNYVKQLDSLNAVITGQRETIMKLQKLDVMMEQQRSKIQ